MKQAQRWAVQQRPRARVAYHRRDPHPHGDATTTPAWSTSCSNAGPTTDHQEATQGWTALIWAATKGHRATVSVLLRHAATRDLPDASGRTAAD